MSVMCLDKANNPFRASIGTIIRLAYTPAIDPANISCTLNRVYFWVVIETGAAIFCACASTWKPLLVRLNFLEGSSTGGYKHQTPNPKSWPLGSGPDDTKLRTLGRSKPESTDDSSSLEALSRDKNTGIICTRRFEAISERISTSGSATLKDRWEPGSNSHASWLAV